MTKEHKHAALLRMAIDELERLMETTHINDCERYNKTINACKAALQEDALDKMAENARELGLEWESEQEPVAWMNDDGLMGLYKHSDTAIPLYTRPTKRLSDDEIKKIAHNNKCWMNAGGNLMFDWEYFARAIEDKLLEKNR